MTNKHARSWQVFPRNNLAIQTQGGSVASLFDPDARGRITPLGNFTGALDSIEYFYGLAPSPMANAAGLGIFEAEVVEFTSGCPEVASSLVYLKAGPVNNVTGGLLPGSNVTTLKQVSNLVSTFLTLVESGVFPLFFFLFFFPSSLLFFQDSRAVCEKN